MALLVVEEPPYDVGYAMQCLYLYVEAVRAVGGIIENSTTRFIESIDSWAGRISTVWVVNRWI